MPWYPEWLWSSTKDSKQKSNNQSIERSLKENAAHVTSSAEDAKISLQNTAGKLKHNASARNYREHFTDPTNLLAASVLTTVCLSAFAFYRTFLRRIPQATLIQEGTWRRRSLLGYATRIGDGDNFHLYHTPGGRLAGWGWLPWRQVPKKGRELQGRTIHVRLAGVDAPELAHFGNPEQPGGREAIEWLKNYIMHRRVRAYVYKKDQYDRAVATVYVWKWLIRRDVGLQMLKKGLATVYDAKTGAEFGSLESKYRKAEQRAKRWRRGIWSGKKAKFESPGDYKRRMKEQEGQSK